MSTETLSSRRSRDIWITGEYAERAEAGAVVVFSTTFDHRSVVELCGRYGVHVVMMEPLAVNLKTHKLCEAAKENNVTVLVNYEQRGTGIQGRLPHCSSEWTRRNPEDGRP